MSVLIRASYLTLCNVKEKVSVDTAVGKCLFWGKFQIWTLAKELIPPLIFVLTKQVRKMQTLRTPAAKF